MSLRNYTADSRKKITSPRSLLAMRRQAVRFSDIKFVSLDSFKERFPEESIAKLHHEKHEAKRLSLLEAVKQEYERICEHGISMEEFLYLGRPQELEKLVNANLSSNGKLDNGEVDKSSLAYTSKIRALEAIQKRQQREMQYKAEMEERMRQKEEKTRQMEEAKAKALAKQQEQREMQRIAELEKQQKIEEDRRKFKEKKDKERKMIEEREEQKREALQARQEAYRQQLAEEAARRAKEQEERQKQMEQRAEEYQRRIEAETEARRQAMEAKEQERLRLMQEERDRKRAEADAKQREASRKIEAANKQRAKEDAERRATTLTKLQQGEERLARRREEERQRLEEEHRLVEEKEKARLEHLAKQRELAEKRRLEALQREEERASRAQEQADKRRLQERLRIEEEKLRIQDRIDNAKRLWEQREYQKRVALTKLECKMDSALEVQRQKASQHELAQKLTAQISKMSESEMAELLKEAKSTVPRSRSSLVESKSSKPRKRSSSVLNKKERSLDMSDYDQHTLDRTETDAILATLPNKDSTGVERARPIVTQRDIDQLKQRQNSEILQRINYEQAREEERRTELLKVTDPTERKRLTTLFTRERLTATGEMNELKERHDREMRRLLTGTYRR